MKAYTVYTCDSEYTVLVFANNANEAKLLAMREDEMDDYDYIDLRAKRAKYADGHEDDSERELSILKIRNGWCYEIGDYFIDGDNLDEMIKQEVI